MKNMAEKVINSLKYRLFHFHFWKRVDDEIYLKIRYRVLTGKSLNLDAPKTFNEKLNWLKLHDRKPEYTTMVDKYTAKEYVAGILGDEYIIPTLGVWNRFEDIDFDTLPQQFVLKTTHNSGGIIICRDKAQFNIREAKKKINKWLSSDFYYVGREWPYKDVPHRIICEKYMVNNDISELRDYKFFCFNGMCKCMKVDFDRFIEHHANYYDPQGNLLDFGETMCPPNKDKIISLPDNIEKMLQLSENLSKDIPFLRVDFYNVNGDIYFGELTFFPASGFGAFTKDEWDYKLGEWLKLPEKLGGGYITVTSEFVCVFNEKASRDNSLTDYKFFCFNGTPQFLYISKGLEDHSTAQIGFYDMVGKELPFHRSDYNPYHDAKTPHNFDEMVSIQ